LVLSGDFLGGGSCGCAKCLYTKRQCDCAKAGERAGFAGSGGKIAVRP